MDTPPSNFPLGGGGVKNHDILFYGTVLTFAAQWTQEWSSHFIMVFITDDRRPQLKTSSTPWQRPVETITMARTPHSPPPPPPPPPLCCNNITRGWSAALSSSDAALLKKNDTCDCYLSNTEKSAALKNSVMPRLGQRARTWKTSQQRTRQNLHTTGFARFILQIIVWASDLSLLQYAMFVSWKPSIFHLYIFFFIVLLIGGIILLFLNFKE